MIEEAAIQAFFRGCGAFTLLASCFGRMLPFSARVALILSFSLLFSSGDLVREFLSVSALPGAGGFSSIVDLAVHHFAAELFIGALLALPMCLGCFAMLLFASWAGKMIAPSASLWHSPQPATPLKGLTISFVVLGGTAFFPHLQDVFGRLSESLFVLPGRADGKFPQLLFSANALSLSCQLAWTAAAAVALPIIGVSWAFDFASGAVLRFVRPLRGDPSLPALRILVLGAALAASLYSAVEMTDSLTKGGVQQKRMMRTVEVFRQK